MSQLTSVPSFEVLLIAGRGIALVVGLLAFAWAFRHWRRAALRDTQRVFEQLDLVRSELLIMKEVMHSTTQRSATEARAPAAPVTSTNHGSRGYEIAARLARGGAQKEELMKTCGISSHEAELLVKLHGQKITQAPTKFAPAPRSTPASAQSSQRGAVASATSPQPSHQPANRVSNPIGNQAANQTGRQPVTQAAGLQAALAQSGRTQPARTESAAAQTTLASRTTSPTRSTAPAQANPATTVQPRTQLPPRSRLMAVG